MSLISDTGTLSIVAQPATALAAAAAQMSAGTWLQFTGGSGSGWTGPSVANQNASLQGAGNSGSILHYCNKMPWNPVSKKIEILAEDHGINNGLHYVTFDGNTFTVVGSGFVDNSHGYDHTAINPTTGDMFHQKYQGPAVEDLVVWRKPFGSTTFTQIAGFAAGYVQDGIGTCWWSGTRTGAFNVGGVQGLFLVYNCGDQSNLDGSGSANDGRISGYDPMSATWVANRRGMLPNSVSTLHGVMAYSTVKNVAVQGGGNDNPKRIARLNADGTATSMPGLPGVIEMGIQNGNLNCDPVTGNFLVLSHGQLWELNPSGSGAWTQQTGTRSPPGGVGDPNVPDGVISCEIPDYGVVAYITQTSQTGGTFYLYKHA